MKILTNTIGFLMLFLINGLDTLCAKDIYFDYLPKYRKLNSNYQIDKIEYQRNQMIIYFRFVTQKTGKQIFYNSDHLNSWVLRTPSRMEGQRIQFAQLDISNIKVNTDVIINSLGTLPFYSHELNRGDVVSFKIHFERPPRNYRMMDLVEGKGVEFNQNKFHCFDILIKTKDNPMLGKYEDVKILVQRFENTFNYLTTKAPDNPSFVTENKVPSQFSSVSSEVSKTNNKASDNITTVISTGGDISIEHISAPEPIDYMPGVLSGIDDFKCNSRFFLPDVIFKDNEVKFSAKHKALQNLKLVVQFLKTYDTAYIKIIGHTDIFGDKVTNLDLSKERAMYVKSELVNMGVNPRKISVFYFGGERPLKKYKNGGQLNRRVEVEPVCVN